MYLVVDNCFHHQWELTIFVCIAFLLVLITMLDHLFLSMVHDARILETQLCEYSISQTECFRCTNQHI